MRSWYGEALGKFLVQRHAADMGMSGYCGEAGTYWD